MDHLAAGQVGTHGGMPISGVPLIPHAIPSYISAIQEPGGSPPASPRPNALPGVARDLLNNLKGDIHSVLDDQIVML
ncbi:MAG: hypothetical protein ACRERE_36195 [Candidatus Entotheonellia bacterium]